MTFRPGDDVIVDFQDLLHRGEVKVDHRNGWYTCRIHADPVAAYSVPLGLESVVCVRASHLRHADGS